MEMAGDGLARTINHFCRGAATRGWPMRIKLEPIDSIKPHPSNPRRDHDVQAIANSIRAFGFRQPLVVYDGDGHLMVGHGRLLAAKELGLDKVPVHHVSAGELTPQQAAAYRLADNRSAEGSTWDDALLLAELEALGERERQEAGFEAAFLDELRTRQELEQSLQADSVVEIEEVPIPDPPKIPVSRLGDLWNLGEHKLLCGDCTDAGDVNRIMGDARAILFATDPPYLVSYDGLNHPSKIGVRDELKQDKNKDWSKLYGVGWDESDAESGELWDRFIEVAKECAIQPNAAWYCWYASKRHALLEAIWVRHGAFAHQQIIWRKNRPILTYSHYMWQHEPCMFGWVRGQKPPRTADDYPSTVWDFPTTSFNETVHPTQKPTELFAIPMRQHTLRGNLCYEPFSGSGSQILAGEQLGRRVYAMEIEPAFVDVALKRWVTLTERQPVLDGGGTFEEVAAARAGAAAA